MCLTLTEGGTTINNIGNFYKKNFYKKMSLKIPQNLKKMLRKSPASNALASIFKNLEFFRSYKID